MTSRLDVILKDYELIRAEAVYRLGARQTITTFFVPVVGTIVAAAYTAPDPVRALVLAAAVPSLCYVTIYLWLAETQALRRASKYLYSLSKHIVELVHAEDSREAPPVLLWEQQLRDSIPEADRERYYRRNFVYNTLLFWLPAGVFGLAGCALIWRSSRCVGYLSLLAELLAFTLAVFLFRRKCAEIVRLYKDDDPRNPDTV